jgi:hypothetical protein
MHSYRILCLFALFFFFVQSKGIVDTSVHIEFCWFADAASFFLFKVKAIHVFKDNHILL